MGVISAEIAECEAEHGRAREELHREATFMLSVLQAEVGSLEASIPKEKRVRMASGATSQASMSHMPTGLFDKVSVVQGRAMEESDVEHIERLEAQAATADAKCTELEGQLAASEGELKASEAQRHSLEARLLAAEERAGSIVEHGGAAASRLAELAAQMTEMACMYDEAQKRLNAARQTMAQATQQREEERQRQVDEVQRLQSELDRMTRAHEQASSAAASAAAASATAASNGSPVDRLRHGLSQSAKELPTTLARAGTEGRRRVETAETEAVKVLAGASKELSKLFCVAVDRR